jgi:hypothetical protein
VQITFADVSAELEAVKTQSIATEQRAEAAEQRASAVAAVSEEVHGMALHIAQLEERVLQLEGLLRHQAAEAVPPLPPIPDSPMMHRTFRESAFKAAYSSAEPPRQSGDMFAALDRLLRAYCAKESITYRNDEGQHFFGELQEEAHLNAEELAGAGGGVCQAAQRMWTSTKALRGKEFCSILNDAVREDSPELAETAADMARAINLLCVTANGQAIAVHPPENICYRGGGFDDRFRDFFAPGAIHIYFTACCTCVAMCCYHLLLMPCQTSYRVGAVGREFRQPGYLATSFLKGTTDAFIARSTAPSRVLWRIYIDPVQKCRHVNLVTKRVPDLQDEQEYLFAPCECVKSTPDRRQMD